MVVAWIGPFMIEAASLSASVFTAWRSMPQREGFAAGTSSQITNSATSTSSRMIATFLRFIGCTRSAGKVRDEHHACKKRRVPCCFVRDLLQPNETPLQEDPFRRCQLGLQSYY